MRECSIHPSLAIRESSAFSNREHDVGIQYGCHHEHREVADDECLPLEHDVVVIFDELTTGPAATRHLNGLPLEVEEPSLRDVIFLDLARDDDVILVIDGHETFIKRAVMKGVEQEPVVRRKPLRCRVRITPRLDVARNERLVNSEPSHTALVLIVLKEGVSEVLLIDASPRHDDSVPALW